MMAPYSPISTWKSPECRCNRVRPAAVLGRAWHVTRPPGAASCVSRPGTPPDVVTLKPGKNRGVLPAGSGKLFVRVTVTLVVPRCRGRDDQRRPRYLHGVAKGA
jgi:hypothetical protein